MAQPFDPECARVVGRAVPDRRYGRAALPKRLPQAVFSASQTGVLAFQGGVFSADLALRWRARDGSIQETVGEPARFSNSFRLSPTEETAMVQIRQDEGDNDDLWVVDLNRKLRTRFTFGREDVGSAGLFARRRDRHMGVDGKRGTVFHPSKINRWVRRRRTPVESLIDGPCPSVAPGRIHRSSFKPGVPSPDQSSILLSWSLAEDASPQPWIESDFVEYSPGFSPDGRWVVYGSNESGSWEVYVDAVPRSWSQVAGVGGWGWLAGLAWRRPGDSLSQGQ